MVHVSLGGMVLKGWSHFLPTVRAAYGALRSARAAPGCLRAELFLRGRTYFAFSVWEDSNAMTAWARGPGHGPLMPLAASAMVEFRNHSWQAEDVPSRDAAVDHWVAKGNSVRPMFWRAPRG